MPGETALRYKPRALCWSFVVVVVAMTKYFGQVNFITKKFIAHSSGQMLKAQMVPWLCCFIPMAMERMYTEDKSTAGKQEARQTGVP